MLSFHCHSILRVKDKKEGISNTVLISYFCLFFGVFSAFAQSPYSFCQPDITQFSRQTYGAYNQNWGVTQHPKNRFLYVANSKGLLEFDGSHWKVYELPRKQRVRSVAIDKEGRIYTGALGEFGYWCPDKRGELIYHSLTALVHGEAFHKEEVWNILVTPTGILFQSFAFVYCYRQNAIRSIQPPGNILFIHQVSGRLWVAVIDKGLYELQGDRYILIPGSTFLAHETVNSILPIGTNELLVGTERALYRYNGKQFKTWGGQINAFLQQNRLNRGVLLKSGFYAFGTLLNGVVITAADGQVRYHFNQKNGLQNSTVLSMCQDADGNLWAGLDKGLDLIKLSSPIWYFKDNEGELGIPYDLARFDNNLYLGTNRGVFYKPLQHPEIPFKLVPGMQGQVWDLAVVDNQLLCGHNKGTFRIKGAQAQLLSKVTGGWVLGRLKRYPDKLIQGTYTDLCIYQKDARGNWMFSHSVNGFSAPVRQLDEDGEGNIWVNKASNLGLQRLRLSPDLRRIVTSKQYADDERHSPILNQCRVQNRLVVTSTSGLRVYDSAHDQFMPALLVYPWAYQNIRKIFPMPDSSLFLLRQDGTVAWTQPHGGSVTDIPVKTNQWVEEFEKIAPLDSAYVAFCREDGFALLPRSALSREPDTVASPIIRTIVPLDDPKASRLFYDGSVPESISFTYKQANLLITFATPYYTRPVKYSYWLENSSPTWSPYATASQKEFNNLAPGQYTFHLKSNLSPIESTLTFTIQSPWYWNEWSKFLYVLAFSTLCWLLYQLHLRRVATQQNRVRRRMEAKLRHQEEQSQREIILLQKEQLEQGLIQKSEELANSTMALIQKNELLIQLKDELSKVKTRSASRLVTDDFQRINSLIESNISSDQDWKLFESNFNKVHEQFLKQLLDHYPELGQGDLKLAAYLRMNLSTKEIAQLLNITYRSVELKRYRLRKKLSLDAEINLSEFMMKY